MANFIVILTPPVIICCFLTSRVIVTKDSPLEFVYDKAGLVVNTKLTE